MGTSRPQQRSRTSGALCDGGRTDEVGGFGLPAARREYAKRWVKNRPQRGALVLLQRLKARFPTARDSSGHCLFISAFMIPSKVICDDTYSNKSWGIDGQGMFQQRKVNQMEG